MAINPDVMDLILQQFRQIPVADAQSRLDIPMVEQVQPQGQSTRETILGALAAALQGFAAGTQGRPTGSTALDRLRERRLQEAQTETALRVRGREEKVRAARDDLAVARQDKRDSEQRQFEMQQQAIGRKQQLEDEARGRRLKLQDRMEDIIAQAESVEPGLGKRIQGMFDFTTPEERGQALGVVVRRQAEIEKAAASSAAGKENMDGALLIAEEGSAKLINGVVFGGEGVSGFDPTTRGGESRAAVQRMFRIRLEEQMAVLRGSGYSEEFVQEWARSKQARLESILQELQASTADTSKARRPAQQGTASPPLLQDGMSEIDRLLALIGSGGRQTEAALEGPRFGGKTRF